MQVLWWCCSAGEWRAHRVDGGMACACVQLWAVVEARGVYLPLLQILPTPPQTSPVERSTAPRLFGAVVVGSGGADVGAAGVCGWVWWVSNRVD